MVLKLNEPGDVEMVGALKHFRLPEFKRLSVHTMGEDEETREFLANSVSAIPLFVFDVAYRNLFVMDFYIEAIEKALQGVSKDAYIRYGRSFKSVFF